jgi:hypothetical protein
MRSLSILLPAGMGHEWNAVLEHHGMGPRNLSVLCWSDGALMIGCHAWEQDAARYTHPGRPSWMTVSRYNEISGSIVASDQPLGAQAGVPGFEALTQAQGVSWGASFPDLPAAGSGDTVTAGAFYRVRSDPRIEVVLCIQTHQRHDPSHTDLQALAALFSPYLSPFTPHPWRQPQGAHDAYPLLNLIGGPMLVIHNGRRWRNTHGNGNTWEPGVFGWADEGPA